MYRSIELMTKVIASALTISPFVSMSARADIVGGVGIGGNVEYSTNPYLLDTPHTGSTRARISISPYVEETMARSKLRLSGDASFSKFSRRYKEAVDLSTQLGYQTTLSQYLSVNAGMSIGSSIGGNLNLAPTLLPVDPLNVVPPINDLGLIGTQDRTAQASASVGLVYTINDRSSLSLNYSASVLRYPDSVNRAEYSTISQNLGYSRTLSSRASVGASFGVTRVDYRGGPLGDAVILSPSVNGSFRLNSRWRATASAGFSSSRLVIAPGVTRSSTSLVGGLNLCQQGFRTSFCVDASRSTSASSLQGVSATTTFGMSYSYKLSARDDFTASGAYSRASSVQQLGGLSTDYISASTSLSHKLSQQLSAAVTAGYSRNGYIVARSNVTATIGINYRFGNR